VNIHKCFDQSITDTPLHDAYYGWRLENDFLFLKLEKRHTLLLVDSPYIVEHSARSWQLCHSGHSHIFEYLFG